MKKQLLILSFSAFMMCGGNFTHAQTFKTSGKTITELCSEPVSASIEGDINKDGVKDLIISTENQGCAFYFGKVDGGYTLFRDYDISMPTDAKITINDKGVLRIQNNFGDNSDVFLFRFQNNGLVLIGGKKDRHKSEHYDYSYNFSTGKMIKTSGEGSAKTSVTQTMPKQPALKFGWIPLKWDMLDYLFDTSENGESLALEDMLAYGIFRRMQDAEMMHWALCEYDSYYGKALKDADDGDGWTAYGSHESPGSYNCYTDLSIQKLNNGTYKINTSETMQDRSYESQLNEDYSNLDDLDVPEDETTKLEYIFDDGKFIEQK